MLGPERQLRIARLIKQRLSMTVQGLSEEFGVSAMTIRRDLALLEEKGLVARVHGGAMAPETPMTSREDVRGTRNVAEKAAIAAMAATLVQDGQTLFIDAGTTTTELARRLRERRGLTVVSNSLRVLSVLADSPGVNLIGLGGSVYGGAHSFVGPMAEAAVRRFNVDMAFMGIASLSLEHGLTEINFFEAAVKTLMIERAQRTILLCDHSKFERVSPVGVAPLTTVDSVITDQRLPAELATAYHTAGVHLRLAPIESG